jgi:ribonuclease-3
MSNKVLGKKDLGRFEKIIQYKFNDINVLTIALTHSSYASEFSLKYSNERMELLGDAVLGFVVIENLYKKFPESSEGELTKLKSRIVSAQNVSSWAKEISLSSFLYLGRGQDTQKNKSRENLLCDAFECIVGAIFLDSGIEEAKKFILNFVSKPLLNKTIDFKSNLQELMQSQFGMLPKYKTLKITGPQHDRFFEIAVYFQSRMLGKGSGHSKKEAQQNAAQEALNIINDDKHQQENSL